MNAKFRLLMVLSLSVLASACGKDDGAGVSPAPAPEASLSPQSAPGPASDSDPEKVPVITAFDINNIPVTNKELGEYPFFSPPKGYRYVTDSLGTLDENISIRDPDRTLYSMGTDRIHLVEGRTFKAVLQNEKQKSTSERDFSLIQRHYEDAITAAGGVKVFDEKMRTGKSYGPQAPNNVPKAKPSTSRNVGLVYVIHKQDMEAWFAIDCGGEKCSFTATRKRKM
ncbi:MAG: hypothetical protein FWH56_06585 [Betaproteobacteria bacterium]|nr:hypothetical protein [Betaproteobacteria bacterium]